MAPKPSLGFMAADYSIKGQNISHRSPPGDHLSYLPQMAQSMAQRFPAAGTLGPDSTDTSSLVRKPPARKRPPHDARDQTPYPFSSRQG